MNIIVKPKVLWSTNSAELKRYVEDPGYLETLTHEQRLEICRYAMHKEFEDRPANANFTHPGATQIRGLTDIELETINKLYLELSQIATTKTKRELELEELLRSAHCIAERKGEDTQWERFANSIARIGIGSVTARTYRVLESDKPAIN